MTKKVTESVSSLKMDDPIFARGVSFLCLHRESRGFEIIKV